MWSWGRKPEPASAPATLPVSRAEWRTLPPIRRIAPEHPLINPVQRFSDSLASWQNPSYLQPLGHRIGPAEPAGTADLTAPVTVRRSAVDTPLARPPRRGAWSRLWGAVAQRSARPSDPEPPAATETHLPAPDGTPAASHDHPVMDSEPPGTIAVDPPGDEVLPRPIAALAGTQSSAVSAMPDTRPVQRMAEPALALPAPHREPLSPAVGTAEAPAQHVAAGDELTTVQPSPTVQPTPAVQPTPIAEPLAMVERTAAAQPVEAVRSIPAALPIVAVQPITAVETTPAVRTIAAGPPDDGGDVPSTGRTDASALADLPLAATEVTPQPASSVQRATDSAAVRSIVPPTPGRPPAGEAARPWSPLGSGDLTVAPVDLPVFRLPTVAAPEPPATTVSPEADAPSDVDTVPTVSALDPIQRTESAPLPDRSTTTNSMQRLETALSPGPVVQRTDPPSPQPLSPRRLGLGAPVVPERFAGTELHPHGTAGPLAGELPPMSLQRTHAIDATTTPPAPGLAAELAIAPAGTELDTVLPTLGAPPEPSPLPDTPPSRALATEPAPVVMRTTEPATPIVVPPPIPVLDAGHAPGEPVAGQPVLAATPQLPVSRLIGDADPLTHNHSAGHTVPLGQSSPGPAIVSRVPATSAGYGSPSAGTVATRTADLPPVPLAIQRTDYYGTAPSPVLAQPRPAPSNGMPPPFAGADTGQAPTFSVVVQRDDTASAPEPAAAPEPGPPPAATPASGPASPDAAPAPAPAQASGVVPEELVKKLFDPLLRRLKTELRFDRERRGRLTDLSQ